MKMREFLARFEIYVTRVLFGLVQCFSGLVFCKEVQIRRSARAKLGSDERCVGGLRAKLRSDERCVRGLRAKLRSDERCVRGLHAKLRSDERCVGGKQEAQCVDLGSASFSRRHVGQREIVPAGIDLDLGTCFQASFGSASKIFAAYGRRTHGSRSRQN